MIVATIGLNIRSVLMAATAQQFRGRYLACCKFLSEFVQLRLYLLLTSTPPSQNFPFSQHPHLPCDNDC